MTRDLALGALLRLSRLRAGLTQRELAALSGVSEREISDLERAVRLTPRAHTLAALATALHLPPATHARLVRAVTVPPPLTPQRPAVAAPPPPAPTPDPATSAHAVTALLLPLIDHAVQRALAPLAQTIAQQTATLDRLATALAALTAALPPPLAAPLPSDAPPPHPHARAASQDAHQDNADHDNLREDSLDRQGTPDQDQDRRRAARDRRAPDAVWTAPDRRLAPRDRRAQQDRDRFEDAIMAPYVSPPLTTVPFTEDV